MYYDGKECEIINKREKEGKIYYDILLPERNVELKSLFSINNTNITTNEYAGYCKDNYMEIVLINKIDLTYDYAYIQIYKSNIPSNFLDNFIKND